MAADAAPHPFSGCAINGTSSQAPAGLAATATTIAANHKARKPTGTSQRVVADELQNRILIGVENRLPGSVHGDQNDYRRCEGDNDVGELLICEGARSEIFLRLVGSG